jgi:hypothetical protein
MMIRRELILAAGSFDESLCVAEDTQLFYRLALRKGFAYVNSLLLNVSRNEGGGLSSDANPNTALRRHLCYLRVQSELYLSLIARDRTAASHVRKRFGYFALRSAEITCAMNDDFATRELGAIALRNGGINRLLIKSAILLIAPALLRSKLRRKWGFDKSGV